jgi:hypothetical protein
MADNNVNIDNNIYIYIYIYKFKLGMLFNLGYYNLLKVLKYCNSFSNLALGCQKIIFPQNVLVFLKSSTLNDL